jgi:ribosomal-protein-alanine N-acetyltransferase
LLIPGNFGGQFALLINKIFYGAGGLNDLSIEHKKAEIGLCLLPDFWGKGIMAEVMP